MNDWAVYLTILVCSFEYSYDYLLWMWRGS